MKSLRRALAVRLSPRTTASVSEKIKRMRDKLKKLEKQQKSRGSPKHLPVKKKAKEKLKKKKTEAPLPSQEQSDQGEAKKKHKKDRQGQERSRSCRQANSQEEKEGGLRLMRLKDLRRAF